jgi:hypothetical protein
MATITAEYFIGKILIPNISETDNASLANADDLAYFIALYLRKLLGNDLFDDYSAGIAEDPKPAKWKALEDEIYWSVGTVKLSPVANYIFFHFWRNRVTVPGANGDITPTYENAVYANADRRLVEAWNQMAEWSAEIMEWIEEHVADYPGYDPDADNELRGINAFGI